VATVIQLGVVLAATNWLTFAQLKIPLLGAGLAAITYGAIFTFKNIRDGGSESMLVGRAFSLKMAFIFAGTIVIVQLASAALGARWGRTGVIAAASVAGFADAHSAAVSVASLVASGKLSVEECALPILAALTTNTVTKTVAAITGGGRHFAFQIIPGLVLVVLSAWFGTILPFAR
jgi:uncharacterized membrane protein (DUF4010 family)